MKSLRVSYWLGGLIGMALVSLALERSSFWPEWGPLALSLAWGLIGILGEMFTFACSMHSPARTTVLRDVRPADGTVALAPMSGIRGVANPSDPRFQRFEAIDPCFPSPPATCLGSRRCTPLLGRIVWVSLFVGCDGKSWTNEEIARAHKAMFKAGAWIEAEAIRWNAPVNIELSDTYFVADAETRNEVEVALIPHGDRLAPADAHEPTKLLVATSRAAASLGFRDAVDWLAQTHGRIEADVRIWLVHVRRSGCSQVIAEHDTDLGSVRFAVCYARESLFPEPLTREPFCDPVTIAHETLHLFEATDKYEVPLRSFPRRTVTSRDVMRLSRSKLSQLRIDSLTACEIGWSIHDRS